MSRVSLFALLTTACVLAHAFPMAAGEVPPRVPAKYIAIGEADTLTSTEVMQARDLTTRPTLPDARLPQYRLTGAVANIPTIEQTSSADLRLLLILGDEVLLVELQITIDDEPFWQARERRIHKLLEVAREPKATPTETANRSQNERPALIAPRPGDERTVVTFVPQPTVPAYVLPIDAAEYVRRYAAATGTEPTREELHWLLAKRLDGPILLPLHHHFQRFRANERPAFHVLDRDRDGTLSAKELDDAVRSLNECDLNRDRIITFEEIDEASDDPRLRSTPDPRGPEMHLLTDSIDVATLQRLPHVLGRFDANENGTLDDEEFRSLHTAEPDLRLAFDVQTIVEKPSHLMLGAFGQTFGRKVTPPSATDPVVIGSALVTRFGSTQLEWSAVRSGSGDQIALGVVQDGYPLLPHLDPDGDGRLTIRELRNLDERLASFDRDRSGAIEPNEIPTTVRICIGHGPLVHRELGTIRALVEEDIAPSVTAPEWFTRMDRNRDDDLTRDEFPGTDEQFTALDADDDQLVSAAEAVAFEKRQTDPAPEQTSSEEGP